MANQHFFFRLLGPRPTFAYDMTEAEAALMQEHGRYVHGHFEAGLVLAYGPVLDPDGAFGMAVIEAADRAEAERFAAEDPSVRAGMNRCTIAPMRIGGIQASREALP